MLVIGSRGSKLALWQAHHIEAQLAALGEMCRIEVIKTTGDITIDVPLAKVGSKGMFTKEIEDALLSGEIDLAVHSLKDMPTTLPGGLTLSAIPEREDVRDAVCGCTLARLPQAAKAGTSSLRRAAQLRGLRPDLAIEFIRGNVDTRLRKLHEGEYDVIVLAAAGLKRLGLEGEIGELLAPEVMYPAVGQGALAVETRDDEGPAQRICRALDHAITRAAVTAERALLAALGGGCQVPLGAYAKQTGPQSLHLRARVISHDGLTIVGGERTGSLTDPEEAGRQLAEELLNNGAREILEAVYGGLASNSAK